MLTQNTNGYQINNSFLNLELLPPLVQQELIDYYTFLLSKYEVKTESDAKKEKFFKSVERHRFKLPDDYKFDRDLANER
jgi:hypothetical protein